jgi:phospholipid/cholesterol/gamma-HCH transport system permease protein
LDSPSQDARVTVSPEADATLRVVLSGRWTLQDGLPPVDGVVRSMEGGVSRLAFEAPGLETWGSGLVAFVHAVATAARSRDIAVDVEGLPEGARQMLALASSTAQESPPAAQEDDALTARVGRVAHHAWRTALDAVDFVGEAVLAVGAFLAGRAAFRRVDLSHAFEATGVAALGIVALINFLIGAVLAFVGAVQLQQFGAAIYVASLVAIGVTRELGALMTGIVMAGRTGASFAAVLGTMTVNEEIDALRTMGMKTSEFLVLPRILATTAMMPVLVAYADVLGLLGGMFVGVTLLDLGTVQYLRQTQESLPLRHVLIGVTKGLVFGLVVALTGCYYGLRCGRSAAAVGEATQKAVVMGIVLVVVTDAVFTVLLHALRL